MVTFSLFLRVLAEKKSNLGLPNGSKILAIIANQQKSIIQKLL